MTTTAVAISQCHHYWVLAPPQGQVSRATCSRCQAECTFPVEPEPIKALWPTTRPHTLAEKKTNGQADSAIKSQKAEKRTRTWYQRHREAILQDFKQLGLEGTRRQWATRGNTLEKLLALWGQPVGGMGQLEFPLPLPLSPSEKPCPSQLQVMADRILAALIGQRLISSNYLAIGLCIMEALAQALTPPPSPTAAS